jgi:GR25 family glycosyltransferase involved in LPS biosynthesis/GT2 family glycosyltransferase
MGAPSRTRIKLIGNFCSPEELCREWERMSQGELRWNDIEVTWEDQDVDFYVIINAPWPGERYVPARTIVFQMEPWCGEPYQMWGVKTWGEWAIPDQSQFLQVRTHRTHLNNAFWQLKATYDQLRTRPIAKTRVLATICSPKYFDPGHIRRVDFLKFIEQKDDDIVRVELYARDNPLGFSSWVGPHPPGEKDIALLPYRYFFAAENNHERNFITEKLWEPLLTETLCFYWGCPNAADWIDPRAFIPVDLDDFEQAFRTIKQAILRNEWEKRLDVIRREKRKVLEHYQFFPTLERILHHELRLPPCASDAEVTYHKYFADALGAQIATACFVHSFTHEGDTSILAELLASIEASGLLSCLDRLYVINFGDEATLPLSLDRYAGRVRLVDFSRDGSRGEAPTLDLIRTFAAFNDSACVLYLHTKGASHAHPNPHVADWRRLMLHFLVERHADARAALATHDVVGCNLLDRPQRHFSGNFWWANSRHLKTLPPVPTSDRHEGEWWVLSGGPARAASLHDSGVDHYREPYDRQRYASATYSAPSDERSNAETATGLEAEVFNDECRRTFDLAQRWFDAEQFDKALDAYRRRASMGGWSEEVFYSRYRAAACLEQLGSPGAEARAAYEACFREFPHRAEPLVRAATLARESECFREAYELARRAARITRPGSDALFVETDDYEYRALDEQAIAAYYCGSPGETFDVCTELLDHRKLPDGERPRIERNRDFSVPHLKDALLRSNAELVARLASRPPSLMPSVTLCVTSCRRLGLFIGTVCSFLNACTDIELVDRFLCVDDNSSTEDRDEMRRRFPFFEFVCKGPDERGHARSLNLIREAVRTPWLILIEDDWHFFAKRAYLGPALEILEEKPELGQVLFNRNYAETLDDREIPGGFAHRSAVHRHRYVVHEHYSVASDGYRRFQDSHRRSSSAWWPHFSLRPAVVRTSVFERVGPFDEDAAHFEYDYAQRYVQAGFQSCFFDGVFALHAGRLTSQRDDPTRPNAYVLNEQPQFGAQPRGPISNISAITRLRCRVKLVSDWAPTGDLFAAFERQSKGGGQWDEIEITTDDDADYYVLFNWPGAHADPFVAARTIVVPMEPPCAAASWGEWAAPDPRRFVQVRSHQRFPNCSDWRLGRSWSELRETTAAKSRDLSTVISSKPCDPGQTLHIAFLQCLENNGTQVDIFGYDCMHRFRRYRGSLPPRDKTKGLLPYRYTIAVENNPHANYYTANLLDALLAECLPFYWGCPNLDDYIDPRAFIRLPLEDLDTSRQIIEEAIANDEWSRRIDLIRREKRRILDELQLFPTLARIVRGHRFVERLGVKVINLDRRIDRLESFRHRLADVAGPALTSRVERFAANDGLTLSLTPEIQHTFRGNDFGYRRGIIGCALSHLALWRELAAGDAPGFLIFEDDVTLCHGFEGQLVELCGELERRHPAFDLLLLGCHDWAPRPEDNFEAGHRAARLRPFEGSRYIGGAFAYVLSHRGAQRLLGIVERDGIQNGIDRFVHRKESELELLVATPHIAQSPLVPPGSGLDSDIENDFETLRPNEFPLINAVIFSKDRAMQLRLLLDSIGAHAEGVFRISIIYTFSTDEFGSGYEKLIIETAGDEINWIRESSFRQDVLDALKSDLQYTCFFTDDDVLFDRVSGSDMVCALYDESVLCFSMRLGKNTDYCYALNAENRLVAAEEAAGLIKFDWSIHGSDYGYPLSLDGHVFRTNEIRRMTEAISFSDPNTYEGNLQIFGDHPRRRMAAYVHSTLVGVPVNRVQGVHSNRNGEKFAFSTSDLNSRYLSGERINLSALDFSCVRGCHQELEYEFTTQM